MQAVSTRRSNPERTRATREALVSAARALFVAHGFAGTSTPRIADVAGVTRGALYHHFRDKADLFRAVLEEEARAVAAEIQAAADLSLEPRAALMAGAGAYLDAMTVVGRTRLLLIEGPAVLGGSAMRSLDEENAERTLVQGLAAVLAARASEDASAVQRLAVLLSAAFDRTALAIDEGGDAAGYRAAMLRLLGAVVTGEPP